MQRRGHSDLHGCPETETLHIGLARPALASPWSLSRNQVRSCCSALVCSGWSASRFGNSSCSSAITEVNSVTTPEPREGELSGAREVTGKRKGALWRSTSVIAVDPIVFLCARGSNPLNYLPQINQLNLASKRNLQPDGVRLLNHRLDRCLDNSAAMHVHTRSPTLNFRLSPGFSDAFLPTLHEPPLIGQRTLRCLDGDQPLSRFTEIPSPRSRRISFNVSISALSAAKLDKRSMSAAARLSSAGATARAGRCNNR